MRRWMSEPIGGRPSRNRKRPTDHVGAYPRARAFPAVPPSPPLVMQRHRILSCDGEASRRILVPQIDSTLLSPSAGGDTNLSTRHTLADYFPTGENRGEVALPRTKNLLGRWRSRKEGGAFQSSLRICETGARSPGSRPLERENLRRARASAALVFDQVFGPGTRQQTRPTIQMSCPIKSEKRISVCKQFL